MGATCGLHVEGVRCTDSGDAIRFKTPAPAHISTNYSIKDVMVEEVTTGLSVCGVKGASFSNISGEATKAGSFKTCTNVTLTDIHIKGGGQYSCGSAISGMHSEGIVQPQPCHQTPPQV